MLKDELKKIDISKYKYLFENQGIILFCPSNKVFYKIAFGSGDCSEFEEGCDDYMYIQMDIYAEDGEFYTDWDGGQMDFAQKDHSGYINDEKLIRDCLELMDCPDIENVIFIRQYE